MDGALNPPIPPAPAVVEALGDYSRLMYHLAPCANETAQRERFMMLLRVALECSMALHHTISLHAACIELDGRALAFTGAFRHGKIDARRCLGKSHGRAFYQR